LCGFPVCIDIPYRAEALRCPDPDYHNIFSLGESCLLAIHNDAIYRVAKSFARERPAGALRDRIDTGPLNEHSGKSLDYVSCNICPVLVIWPPHRPHLTVWPATTRRSAKLAIVDVDQAARRPFPMMRNCASLSG
jgi:hypothetical protein